MRTEIAQPVRLSDYRVPDYLIDHVDLDISLDRHSTIIKSRLSIRTNPLGRPGAPLVLDGDELKPTHVWLDGAGLDLAAGFAKPQNLTIETPPQRPFVLEVTTQIDPTANTKLMGLYRSGSAYCTQCEAEGFRRITYFLDRPDVLSRYTLRIEADKVEAPVLLGNGNCIAQGDVSGTNRHFAVWEDPHLKPCYLFALVAGDLGMIHDQFITMSGRKVALGIFVEHGREARAHYAMDALKRSMLWDEKVFLREYDLDVFNIVAVSDFNMGAMENKGLNVFNDKLVLASPMTATDTDYAQIEAVIAHEYFHNWTGNRITCRDWFQLCLKEGLTVYRDQEFSADERSRAVERISDVRGLRANQFVEDSGPLAHNVRPETYHEINNFYTATVYEKGAELIRMLKCLIGPKAFHVGMQLYFRRCDGMAATMEDFLACFAETSGRDLTHFQRWYSQAGTPVLTVKSHHDTASATFNLEFSQSTAPTPGQTEKQPFLIPMAIGLVKNTGGDLVMTTGAENGASDEELATGIFELAGSSRKITFTHVTEAPVPSLMRGFSAPVRVEANLSEADLLTLAAHDSDTFNRWQAVQTCALNIMTRNVGLLHAGKPLATELAFTEALLLTLLNAGKDPALAAQIISLPGESDVAREIGRDVDPDAIRTAREHLRGQIGRALSKELRAQYAGLALKGPYSPDAASTGARALRNAVLLLLSAGEPEMAAALAEVQLAGAENMTDQIAALDILSRSTDDRWAAALALFYAQHKGDALVIDKWLGVQAMIPSPQTVARVRALTQHEAFSFGNPNRVRALIGVFANANPTCFHALDGSGYELLAKVVLKLDPGNPQIAARLLNAMRSWRQMEPARRALAQAQLQKIAATNPLSADVRDIVTRSLA